MQKHRSGRSHAIECRRKFSSNTWKYFKLKYRKTKANKIFQTYFTTHIKARIMAASVLSNSDFYVFLQKQVNKKLVIIIKGHTNGFKSR